MLAAARASRSNRARISSSLKNSDLMILMATGRRSRSSSAAKTRAVEPTAIRRRST